MSDIDQDPPTSNEEILIPDIVASLLENQREDISVEKKRIQASQKEQENAHQYALKALEAQYASQKALWKHVSDDRKRSHTYTFVIVILVILFLALALFIGYKDIVIELIKLIAIGFGGFGGGYAYATSRRNVKETTDESS